MVNQVMDVGAAAVVVSGLVQVFKPFVAERYIPVLALLVGVLVVVSATLAQVYHAATIGDAVLTGLLAGLSSIGLYEVQGGAILGPKAS